MKKIEMKTQLKDIILYLLATVTVIAYSLCGINILGNEILYFILGFAILFSVAVNYYEYIEKRKSVKTCYLTYLQLSMGLCFVLSFLYNIIFV